MKVRYYGHVGQPTGYGRAASDLCMALVGAGVELEIRPLTPPGTPGVPLANVPLPLASRLRRDTELDSRPDLTIVHTIPQSCKLVRDTVQGSTKATESPWIAYTTWEATTRPTSIRAAMCEFDQVWHPCRANADALRGKAPARVLPHCFDPESLSARHMMSIAPRDNALFTFYYIGAWSDRKAPDVLLDAYARTFRSGDRVQLVMQCAGADDPAVDRALDNAIKLGANQITIHIGRKSDDEILDMHRRYDCFVTAAKGEAWNLPCFDAMLAGRHIIAPLGQGSDDYLADTDATLYDSHPGTAWVEPDRESLQRAMHEVYSARYRDLWTGYDPVERYGYAAVARLALNYMQECLSCPT